MALLMAVPSPAVPGMSRGLSALPVARPQVQRAARSALAGVVRSSLGSNKHAPDLRHHG